MHRGHTVVDVDAHFIDHFEQVSEYMDDDDPWKEKFERGAKLDEDDSIISFWPKITHVRSDNHVHRDPGYGDVFSREDVLDVMDEIGIDKIVLISDQMLNLAQKTGDDLRGVKYARAYVEFMLDRIADPDSGIYVTIPMPYHEPAATVELLEDYGDDPAVVGVCTVTAGVEPQLGHRKYDVVYEAAQEKGLPLVCHAGGSGLDQFPFDGFSTTLETHMLGFVVNNMAQLTSLIVQGVPEKFPDLDVVFQESGIFYLPMMMYRLDQEYLAYAEDAPLLDKRPSEYMKEFYYATQPLEVPPTRKYFEYVLEMIDGPNTLMYASDYPHPDYDEPSAITDMPFLSAGEQGRILGGNAEVVFGI